MSETVIRVGGLGKQYRIGDHQPTYRTLAGAVVDTVLRRKPRHGSAEFVWALQDLSFEVQRGDTVGIIGRNGAGKSTLLKLLSRITDPTTGFADVRGRIGALLELGIGFHLELTGRENLYLNGAILGMSRHEIRRKLDDIVAFAEIEKFIDTPVKRYSTGMYMRLAFAVAAHLDPDILIVDEVLAVGDVGFQKKCLSKMDQAARDGRTVLFVAHNLGAIAQFCHTGILLDRGRLHYHGDAATAIQQYLTSFVDVGTAMRTFDPDPDSPFQVLELTAREDSGEVQGRFDLSDPITLRVKYVVRTPRRGMELSLTLARNGTPLWCSLDTDAFPAKREERSTGEHMYEVAIPPNLLKAGLYSVSFEVAQTNQTAYQLQSDAITFQVDELREDAFFAGHGQNRPGMIVAPVTWSDTPARRQKTAVTS